LAQYLKTEIISADSRQCYKELSIGTAKPSKEELNLVPHHFIDCSSIHEPYNAGKFELEYLEKCHDLFQNHDHLILCGGTGLYIDALTKGLDNFPEVNESTVTKLEKELANHGIQYLQEQLQKLDLIYYQSVDLNNAHRLIRALSVIRESGNPYSSYLNQEKKPRNFKPIYILLEMDRKQLYQRINFRVDQMFAQGLLDEAKSVYPYKHLKSLQTVGYQELFAYFYGHINLDTAKELIKRNSRRYAKRQMTWFRRSQDWNRFAHDDFDGICDLINNY
ncbi:MAG: tRNA (adenosine(37)-N6)-dimethylallyltransferase MiaA, partial [Bacteroidota bacterium]